MNTRFSLYLPHTHTQSNINLSSLSLSICCEHTNINNTTLQQQDLLILLRVQTRPAASFPTHSLGSNNTNTIKHKICCCASFSRLQTHAHNINSYFLFLSITEHKTANQNFKLVEIKFFFF